MRALSINTLLAQELPSPSIELSTWVLYFSFQSHRLKLSLDSPANARMRLDGVQSTETSNLITVPVSIYDLYMPEILATAEPDNDHIFYSTNKGIYIRKISLSVGKSVQEVRWLRLGRPIGPRYMSQVRVNERSTSTSMPGKLAPIAMRLKNGSRYDIMGFTLGGQLKLARDVDLNVGPVWETLPNFPDVSLIRAMVLSAAFGWRLRMDSWGFVLIPPVRHRLRSTVDYLFGDGYLRLRTFTNL